MLINNYYFTPLLLHYYSIGAKYIVVLTLLHYYYTFRYSNSKWSKKLYSIFYFSFLLNGVKNFSFGGKIEWMKIFLLILII